MSGVVSVGAAVAATAFAATEVAAVGLTIGSAFAITAAVGATVGAVGVLTKVKELQYVGAALGAVGLVGSLASAAGLFGTASELGGAVGEAGGFGSWMSGAGDAVSSGGSTLGTDAATWANTVPELASTTGAATGGAAPSVATATSTAAPQVDVVDMVTGRFQAPTGTVDIPGGMPEATPQAAANAVPGGAPQVSSGEFPSSSDAFTNPLSQQANTMPAGGAAETAPAPPDVGGQAPDPARNMTPWAQDGGSTPWRNPLAPPEPNMSPAPLDANGRIIPQGDAIPGGYGGELGPSVGNQSATPSGGVSQYAPPESAPATTAPVTGNAATPPPSAASGAQSAASAQTAPEWATGVTGNAATPPPSAASGAQSAASAQTAPEWATGVTGKVATTANPPSTWDSLWQFTQKNPMLMFGAIQATGSFASGALSPLSPATVGELESRRRSNEATAALYDAQEQMLRNRMANMAKMPVASRSPFALVNSVTGRV